MPPRIKMLSISVVAALTLVTAGCSDSDGGGGGNAAVTEENKPYVEAMATSMRSSNDDSEDVVFTDEEIDCIAPRFVNIIGVDRMKENNVEPADIAADDSIDFSNLDLSDDEGNTLYDTFGECDIDLREKMLTGMAADEDATPEMKACMEGVFTDENLRKFMVSSMVAGEDAEDDPEIAPLMGQLMGCAFMGMSDMDLETGN